MKLVIEKSMKNKVISMDIKTDKFSDEENLMLDQLGEPVLNFQKQYETFPVEIDRKIRTGFKVRLKIDGKGKDMDKVSSNIDDFIQEITDQISTLMSDLREQYTSDIKTGTQEIDINY